MEKTKVRRILLVDDEALVLDGLRRVLRRRQRHWDIETATDGTTALAILDDQAFDAIVTDMRMPEIDGAELLTRAAQLQPGIIRIILTGDPSEAAVFRSIGPTHQLISKPCDSNVLADALDRSFRLRETLGSEDLMRLAGRLKNLPSLPELYNRLMEELQSPDVSVNAVGQLVAQDMAMSAKLLQLVNSAFFGAPQPISDPVRAVVVLGIEMVRALVLMFHVFEQLDGARSAGVPLERLFQYGILSAKSAKLIARDLDLSKEEVDRAYLGGLLHDVGLLVLGAEFTDEMREVLDDTQASERPLSAVEVERLGASHADVGAYLLGLWGLPSRVVEAVAYHHRPDQISSSEIDSTWITRWGELVALKAFAQRYRPFDHGGSELTDSDRALLSDDQFDTWVKKAQDLRMGR